MLAARVQALERMSEEEAERLKENIKVANLRMESAYLNDNIFEKLEEMNETVKNEKLQEDLRQIIDETALASTIHTGGIRMLRIPKYPFRL